MTLATARKVTLTALLLLMAATFLTHAQTSFTSSTNDEPIQGHPKIQAMVENLLHDSDTQAFKRAYASHDSAQLFTTDVEGDRVQVVVEASSESDTSTLVERIKDAGGRIETTYESSIQGYLRESTIRKLANTNLVSFVRMPVTPQRFQPTKSRGRVVSEGLDVIGSRAWNEAGVNGEGVKVGIIDSGFKDYERFLGEELPPRDKVETRSFREDTDIECSDCSESAQLHGRGVAEIVHDVAPNASMYLSDFGTIVETQNSIDWMMQQNVDVINSSWGFNTGCLRDDDEGIFEPLIEESREQGITWVTASGNEGQQHWRGQWQDFDGDDQHNFSTSDETLSFDVELFEAERDGEQVAAFDTFFILSWNGDCGNAQNAYQLELSSDAFRSPIEGDWFIEPGTPIKFVGGVFSNEDTSLVGEEITVNVSIEKRVENAPDQLDLKILNCRRCVDGDFDTLNARGSVGVTEPSISPNAMTVGAVHHTPSECGSDCSDGSLLDFSSRGPTGDGRTKPDIAAPTLVSTTAFGEWTPNDDEDFGFSGTSSSSPHVAGAAALVAQAKPDFAPDQIQAFLEDRAEDVGPPDKDNRFGSGILTLGPVPQQEAEPRLTVDPTELSFTATKGEGNPEPRTLEIGNDGGGTLDWSAQTTAPWLQLSRTSGRVSADVEVSVAINDLSPGTHQGRIVVTSSGAEGSPATVPVELTLQEGEDPTRLEVNPSRFTFEARVGDGNPAPQSLDIGSSDGSLDWRATTTANWIGLSAQEGTTPADVRVSVNTDNLSVGEHQGRIVITSSGAENSPVMVDVTLTLSDAPDQPQLEVQPDPPNLDFGEQQAGGQTSLQMMVRNAGGGTLNWAASADADWVTIVPNSGTLSAGEERTIQVAVDTGALDPGEHTTELRITAEDGDQSKTGTIRVRIVDEQVDGQLLALAFEQFTLLQPEDWSREIQDGCVVYTNASDEVSRARVTQMNGSTRTFEIPAGNRLIVCDRVIHIDTRT